MFKKTLFIFLLTFGLVLVVSPVLAAYGLEETAGAAGLKTTVSLPVLIGNIIGTALSLIGVIFFALMIYGGFLWMTARGKDEQAKQGLETVIAAIIGLLIILGAYAITNFVFGAVGTTGPGTTPTTPSDQSTPPSQCAGQTGKVLGCDTCVATQRDADYSCSNIANCDSNTIVRNLCNAAGQGNDVVCCKLQPGIEIAWCLTVDNNCIQGSSGSCGSGTEYPSKTECDVARSAEQGCCIYDNGNICGVFTNEACSGQTGYRTWAIGKLCKGTPGNYTCGN